ncbi:tyrosine-type recombinase/integrase [Haloarchaeobius sp. HRN-SO-5]|uniref:tyrosine-type recombinase/integrase n=1 Tax=Haloarchaeobius sp. HRN-SO-5 TaxID=3446118 RepID=UPI003EB95604
MSTESLHPATQDFINSLSKGRNALAPASIENRQSDLRRWCEWCDEEGYESTTTKGFTIRSFLYDQADEFSNATVSSRYDSLKTFYDHLEALGSIEESPFDANKKLLKRSEFIKSGSNVGEKYNHGDPERFALDAEDVEAMCKNVRSGGGKLRNELIIRLMYQTGVRVHTAAHIKVEDIDRERESIRVYAKKTDDWRTVTYATAPGRPNPTKRLLTQWLDVYRETYAPANESEYLFVSERTERVSPNYINELVREAAENAGIQEVMYVDGSDRNRHLITSHTLRHSFVKRAIDSGIDIKRIQLALGHKDVTTTLNKYAHFLDDDVVEGFSASFDPYPDG